MSAGDPRRGMILVVVLWSIAVLSALAMAAATTFRGFTGVVGVGRDRVQAEGLLTAGLEAAAGIIATLGDRPLDDIETTVTLSAGSVRARLSDEGGRVDVGKAPVELLAAMLRAVGVPGGQADDLAREIDAWRTPADQGGANAAARLSAGAQQGKDPPFSDVRQLANIPGMAPQWVPAIASLATVFGNETVNPLTAPAAVLAALPGVGNGQVEAFLAARRAAPADAARLVATLGPAQKYLAVKTQQAASIRLGASLADGYAAAAHAVIVVLPKDRQPYRVLAWNPVPLASASDF